MDHAGLQAAHRPRQVGRVGEGGTGYFQRNPGGERQGAGYGQENAARTEVQSGGKLEKFLASFIVPPDKNRNCQRQSLPSPAILDV